MKNLMTLTIAVIVFTMTNVCMAQTFRVKAGLNLSSMAWRADYFGNMVTKMQPGFHVGATFEIQTKGKFSFEPGLLLSSKGFRVVDRSDNELNYKSSLNMYYAEIPLNAKITFNAGDARIHYSFGPYVGLGLVGKSKSTARENGHWQTVKETIQWGPGKDDQDFNRLDFGLTAGTGIEINRMQFSVFYSLGLANLDTNSSAPEKLSNRVVGFSMAFKFNK